MQKRLNVVRALFGLVAAVFWFLSAYGKLPPMVDYWDETQKNDPFFVAVKFSAQMNRWAAFFSGLSAFCVGIPLLLPI